MKARGRRKAEEGATFMVLMVYIYFAFVIDLSFDIGKIHLPNIAYYSAKGFFLLYC